MKSWYLAGFGIFRRIKFSLLNLKIFLALFSVGFFWGTTILATKIGVQSVPPWYLTGFRQILAALILLPVLLYKKQLLWIGWANLKVQMTLSILMLVGANGLTAVAEEHLTSSLTSLITALTPILIFIASLMIGIEKFTSKAAVGLLLGFGGIVFIFWDGLKDLANPNYLYGIITLLLGLISWTIGTIYVKRRNHRNEENISLNLFYQFAFAGIIQLIFAGIFSEKPQFSLWKTEGILMIVYLALFCSVITFFAYHYLLKTLLPTKVSILNYINTIIGILLSWLILNEEISFKFIVATALIIAGVFIMNYNPEIFRAKKILKED